jgi:tRNA(Ile)-lysidine synthase
MLPSGNCMKNSLKFAFLEFVNQHQLLVRRQKVLLAVSGGIDSMTLLHLMLTWQNYFKMQIGVGHFNHLIRGKESDRDELFVKEFCARKNIPFFAGRGDAQKHARENKLSLEEAARMLRETFLQKCRREQGFDLIATGHNLNDQAETVLMRLLSGTGPEGLAGIRLRRENYIRPLLFADREVIEQYAAEHHIVYREDRSNRDLAIMRNKIRHQLIPYLREVFSLGSLNSFLNLGLIIQEWLPKVYDRVDNLFEEAVVIESQNKIRLDITTYTRYFSQIQIRILERILSVLSGRDVKLLFNRFRNFTRWLSKQPGNNKFFFDKETYARRQHQSLIFEKRGKSSAKLAVEIEINPGDIYRNEDIGIEIRAEWAERQAVKFHESKFVEYLNAGRLTFPLILRKWRSGDRFQPLGVSYQKKMSDFLTDEKVLVLPKEQMLIVESKGEIAWVVGVRISEKYKVDDVTHKILKLELVVL